MKRTLGSLSAAIFKPAAQSEKVARTASAVLHQVLRAFSYRDRSVLPRIYEQYVRPHLEFAVPAWSPWQKGDIDLIENVQKKMVRAVSGLQGRTYEERLEELGMETLEKRRQDLYLVTTYKILKGIDDVDKVTWFRQVSADRTHRTRATEGGHNIARETSKAELRRNFFSQRVAEKWNELPLHVKNAPSTTVFKASLKRAKHQ